MTDAIIISKVTRIDIDQIVETGDSIGKREADPGMHRIIDEEIVEVMQGCIKILKDKTVGESIKVITEMKVMAETVDRNRSRERSFSRDCSSAGNNRSTSNSSSRSGSRISRKRDRIRCYKCMEDDHFTKDSPTSRQERNRRCLI